MITKLREVLKYIIPFEFIQNKYEANWNEDDILKNYPLTYLIHGRFKNNV